MALDLHKTAGQIKAMAAQLRDTAAAKEARLRDLITLAGNPVRRVDAETLHLRLAAAHPPRSRVTWLTADLPQAGVAAVAAHRLSAHPVNDYTALATDGSQIELDRHGPAQCFLINIGGAVLRYGPAANATLFSTPRLFTQHDELTISDPVGIREVVIDETLLAVKRLVMECQAMLDWATREPPEKPLLLLLDGSLVLWALSGSRYPDHVRTALLQDGLLEALAGLEQLSRRRSLAFVSYISNPRSTEVINLLRLAHCPHADLVQKGCDAICGSGPGKRECNEVADGLMDRDLFERLLRPGERSATFGSLSPIVVSEYGRQAVEFFYLNVGNEVVRLEMPRWVASDPAAVERLHTQLLDQCRKGRGYPVALQEAHEKAVVTLGDRRLFWSMVERSLEHARVPLTGSEKARSKRLRAL